MLFFLLLLFPRLVFANERPRFGWFFFFLRLDHFDWKSFEPEWWCGSLWFGSAVADSLRQLCSTKVTKNRKKTNKTKKLPLIRTTGSFRLIFLSTISSSSSFLFYFSLTQGATGNRMGTTTATTRRPFFFFFQNLYTTGPAELPGR